MSSKTTTSASSSALVTKGSADAAGGEVMNPADIARLQREARDFLSKMEKVEDFDKATAKVHSDQLTMVLFCMGRSKVKAGENYSKMIYTFIPNQDIFRESVKNLPELNKHGAVEVIVDARSKDQRLKDQRIKNFDLESYPIFDAADVDGKPDAEGNIRRIRVTLKQELIAFRNEKLPDVPTNALIVANVEAGAWHNDDGTVVISPKISGIADRVVFSDHDFINICYRLGLWTKNFKTKVRYYVDQMAKFTLDKNARESKGDDTTKAEPDLSWRYRNDNLFILPIGFDDQLGLALTKPEGCFFSDKTKLTTEANLVGTQNDTVRYFATYLGKQWTTNAKTKERTYLNFTIDVAYFDTMERFGISSLANWKILCPVLLPRMKALIMAVEDAERSFNSELVREHIFDNDDPEYLNKPRGDNAVVFSMGTSVRSVAIDAVGVITACSIPGSLDVIKKSFWNGKSCAPTLPEKVKPLANADPNLVNLSELKDPSHYIENPKNAFRVLINLKIMDKTTSKEVADTGAIFSNMSVEMGDSIIKYLASCVLNGKGNVDKNDYLDDMKPEEREAITADHPIEKYIFSTTTSAPVVYVYAIKQDMIELERRRFVNAITRLKLNKVFENIGGVPSLTAAVETQRAEKAPSVVVEEVKEGEEQPGEDDPMAIESVHTTIVAEPRSPLRNKAHAKVAAHGKKKRETEEPSEEAPSSKKHKGSDGKSRGTKKAVAEEASRPVTFDDDEDAPFA